MTITSVCLHINLTWKNIDVLRSLLEKAVCRFGTGFVRQGEMCAPVPVYVNT